MSNIDKLIYFSGSFTCSSGSAKLVTLNVFQSQFSTPGVCSFSPQYQPFNAMPPKIDPDTINAMVAADFKLPEFYRHRPEVWCSFAESQFLLQNMVDDSRKFAYVVSSLHPDVAELNTDTIMPLRRRTSTRPSRPAC